MNNISQIKSNNNKIKTILINSSRQIKRESQREGESNKNIRVYR